MLQYSDLLDTLKKLDEEVSLLYGDKQESFELYIAGGSGLALLNVIDRGTHDIDAIYASIDILDLLEKYDINCRIQTYEDLFPYNYQNRLQRLDIPFRKMKYYVVSLEDIIISKLFAARNTDIQDITNPGVLSSINRERLKNIVTDPDEIMPDFPNEHRYAFFMQNYKDYIEEYKK